MKTLGFSSVLAHMNSMDHITHSLQIYLSGILILTIFFLHTWVSFNKAQFLSLRAHKSLLISGWCFETFVFSCFFHILGMSSSQLTFIFFIGVAQPPTSDMFSPSFYEAGLRQNPANSHLNSSLSWGMKGTHLDLSENRVPTKTNRSI